MKSMLEAETRDEVRRRLDAPRMAAHLAARDADADGPAHPLFGPLTVRQWGVLGHKHADHHLRQFGA